MAADKANSVAAAAGAADSVGSDTEGSARCSWRGLIGSPLPCTNVSLSAEIASSFVEAVVSCNCCSATVDCTGTIRTAKLGYNCRGRVRVGCSRRSKFAVFEVAAIQTTQRRLVEGM